MVKNVIKLNKPTICININLYKSCHRPLDP